jgi:hypothetical protein
MDAMLWRAGLHPGQTLDARLWRAGFHPGHTRRIKTTILALEKQETLFPMIGKLSNDWKNRKKACLDVCMINTL